MSSMFRNIDFSYLNKIKTLANSGAESFFENIRDTIHEYERHLSETQALVWKVACANGAEYVVSEVGYVNPYLIRFEVTDADGADRTLLFHMSSVQFIMQVVETNSPPENRPKIGFQNP